MPKFQECDKCGGDLDRCKCGMPSGRSERAMRASKAHEARCSVATGSALREWTLADERNLADRLANALLSRDPMERISALAYYAAQLADTEAQDVCRVGGVPEAALARARRVDAKLRSVPNMADMTTCGK